MKRYAISDIHGCLKTFRLLLKQIGLKKQDKLYLLGDYIDRGPDSKGVIDKIWELETAGYTVKCLRGNHEQMLLNATGNWKSMRGWYVNGGEATLKSFGVSHPEAIPKTYKTWLEQLPYYEAIEDYVLVHAGFGFVMPNPFDELHSMLWSRNWYDKINRHWLRNRIIIHGHTPQKEEEMQQQLSRLDKIPALGIDNGCVFREVAGYGGLMALDLDGLKLCRQKYAG